MADVIAWIIILMLVFPETLETKKTIAEIKAIWGETCVYKKDNEK